MENIANVASSPDDEAGEKLVNDEKNGHNSKGNVEIRYMTPTSQNGDAKIDIDNLKNAFAGMGKEELMKFAKDPFWVRTRWFLFFLFWFTWVAMLVGAIAIIVLAPKCAAPTPREWYEQSPAYKIDVSTFAKEEGKGDLTGVTTKLEYLKELSIKSVILSNVIDEKIEGFTTVSSTFGTLDQLKKFISTAKEHGINILLTLVPNFSSTNNPMFNKSVAKIEPYTSYYIWAPATSYDGDTPLPPNNWLSVNGGSAWEFNKDRNEFYLHQFGKDQADLNFTHPAVIKLVSDALKYWLELGVSGLYLENIKYLLEDKDLRAAVPSTKAGYSHEQYEFYDHSRTSNLPELTPLLNQWTRLVANNSGVLFLDDISSPRNQSVGNLVLKSQTLRQGFTGIDLNRTINYQLATNSWPTWQLHAKDKAQHNELHLLSLLLPGTPVIKAGAELGLTEDQTISWSNETESTSDVVDVIQQQKNPDSTFNSFKTLIETRKSHSILYGTLETHVFNTTGANVFAYTRIKSGNPGYLVVYNTGANNETVSLQEFASVPEEVTVIARTEPLLSSLHLKTKVDSIAVTLPGHSLAVFSFVPKPKEA